jgi:hypothetical protein
MLLYIVVPSGDSVTNNLAENDAFSPEFSIGKLSLSDDLLPVITYTPDLV